jgi:starch-binding outer membrane protein, SusD/RagB family
MRKHFCKYCLLLYCMYLCSCESFVNVDPPRDRVIGDNAFATDASAKSVVSGIYSSVSSNIPTPFFLTSAVTIYTGLYSDELYATSPAASELEFYTNSVSINNTLIYTSIWPKAYQSIYLINASIAGLTKSETLTPALRTSLLGECKFLRAFHYFYLTSLFGDVPLLTATDYEKNALAPRTPQKEVWAQILADLQEADEQLTVDYPSSGKVRPNKLAVEALLARFYLYQQNWAQAEGYATKSIESGKYALDTLGGVFLGVGKESIWQLASTTPNFNTVEGNNFIPAATATVAPKYGITDTLYNAFTANDKRKVAWINKKTVAGKTTYYPFKYKVLGSATVPITENYVMLRLGEQYLVRAEARTRQDKLADAVLDLNQVKKRAGIDTLSLTTSKEALVREIEKERRLELFAEFGHRWFDLRRTGRANTVLAPQKPGWTYSDTLLPIPELERQRNPLLSQNPGYSQ